MTEHTNTLQFEEISFFDKKENLINIKLYLEILDNCDIANKDISQLWENFNEKIDTKFVVD